MFGETDIAIAPAVAALAAPSKPQPNRWRRVFATLREAAQTARADDARMVYVFARSPASPVAAMVLKNAAALADDGLAIAAVFAELPARGEGALALKTMAREYGARDLRRFVRIADFSGWRGQRQRVRFGRVAAHEGPKLNVARPRLSDGVLIDTRNQPDRAELARTHFSSVWALSRPTPAQLARALAR